MIEVDFSNNELHPSYSGNTSFAGRWHCSWFSNLGDILAWLRDRGGEQGGAG